MTPLFADTSFFVAFLNGDDVDHHEAYGYMADHDGKVITTDWVLVELGNYLSRRMNRERFHPFVTDLVADGRFLVLPADHVGFRTTTLSKRDLPRCSVIDDRQ